MWLKRKPNSGRPRAAADPEAADFATDADACGCAHDDLPTLEEVAHDPGEAMAIVLCRHAFGGLMTGNVRYWASGFDAATHNFGEERGMAVFTRLLALARFVEADRLGHFTFQSLGCSRMSEHEGRILTAIQHARAGDDANLRQAVETLANGGRPDRIRRAVRYLATVLTILACETAGEDVAGHPVASPTQH